MKIFSLPDLGEGLSDAEIVSWHVAPGDHVVADQPLVSVETDKAIVEIPSPWSGNISRLFAEPGDLVAIGKDLVGFDGDRRGDPGAIVGALPEDHSSRSEPAETLPTTAETGETARPLASPAVRQLAQQRGIDLAGIRGSGPDGSITKADLEQHEDHDGEHVVVERVSGVRRAMARSMSRSGAQVVPATVTDQADIEHWPTDADITLRLIRAIEAGVAAEPGLNAWFDPERSERRLHAHIDLGLAVDTVDGLFAPVLRNVANRGDQELDAGLKSLREQVAQRTVPPDELRGQTITLSNFGMIGGRYAALVVVPPQVAILGAGRIVQNVFLDQGGACWHRALPLSLTFDHRVVTGGEAARFLAAAIQSLESKQPEKAL